MLGDSLSVPVPSTSCDTSERGGQENPAQPLLVCVWKCVHTTHPSNALVLLATRMLASNGAAARVQNVQVRRHKNQHSRQYAGRVQGLEQRHDDW